MGPRFGHPWLDWETSSACQPEASKGRAHEWGWRGQTRAVCILFAKGEGKLVLQQMEERTRILQKIITFPRRESSLVLEATAEWRAEISDRTEFEGRKPWDAEVEGPAARSPESRLRKPGKRLRGPQRPYSRTKGWNLAGTTSVASWAKRR